MTFAPLMFVFFTLVANVFELQNEKQRVSLHEINTELKNKEDALRISYANLENKVFQRTRELQAINTQLVQEMKHKEEAIASMKLHSLAYNFT